VGKKPRGLWRPPITLRVMVDTRENPLNVDPSYNFTPLVTRASEECQRCEKYQRTLAIKGVIPYQDGLPFYKESSTRKKKSRGILRCHCGSAAELVEICPEEIEDIFSEPFSWRFYPEWRPGVPDYSDYIQFCVDTWLEPCVRELERRVKEAQMSPEVDEYSISRDNYALHSVMKKGEESAQQRVRKLKIGG